MIFMNTRSYLYVIYARGRRLHVSNCIIPLIEHWLLFFYYSNIFCHDSFNTHANFNWLCVYSPAKINLLLIHWTKESEKILATAKNLIKLPVKSAQTGGFGYDIDSRLLLVSICDGIIHETLLNSKWEQKIKYVKHINKLSSFFLLLNCTSDWDEHVLINKPNDINISHSKPLSTYTRHEEKTRTQTRNCCTPAATLHDLDVLHESRELKTIMHTAPHHQTYKWNRYIELCSIMHYIPVAIAQRCCLVIFSLCLSLCLSLSRFFGHS